MNATLAPFMRKVALPVNVPGQLWLGPMPGRLRPLEQDMAFLTERGVEQIICLAPQGELEQKSPAYAEGKAPIATVQFPIDDFGVPADEDGLGQLALRAATQLNEGRVLFVHCAAGIGRTGTFASLILIGLGFAEEQATALVSAAGSGPETAEQRHLVSRLVPRLHPLASRIGAQ
ncbi:protein-tyrosine phosphatase family protein [Mesorhizobium sp. ANAO-SY3R2]|uniref:protein-tyrosine phosphatase family protein n=1 Tax=Mesorhizobium sp. ANAO-SY3R2 TaxID=3166644 RepID=UPI00366FA39F